MANNEKHLQEDLPPAPCRVRITKCSFEQGWYKNLIGEVFDVDNAGGNKDYVLWEDYAGQRTAWRHIAKQDCEIVGFKNSLKEKDVVCPPMKVIVINK